MKLRLQIFVFALMIIFSACSDRNILKIKTRNFESEIELKQNLVFVFDRDVVADSLLNRWDSVTYIKITPAVAGVFKWNTKSELMFSPESGFNPATDYKAELTNALLKSASRGTRLNQDQNLEFHTPYLTLLESYGHWAKSALSADGIQLVLYLNFNYRVQPSALAQKLHINIDGKTAAYKIASTETSDQVAVSIEGFSRQNLRNIKAEIKIDKGLLCIGSSIPTKKELQQTAEIPLPDKLSITQATGEFEGTMPFIHLYTNQSVDEKDLGKYITVTPALKTTIESRLDGLAVKGAFDPGITYEITVSKEVKGLLGGALEEDYHAYVPFGQLEPSVNFTSSRGEYLTSKGAGNIGVNIVNIPTVSVRIIKIYENNILSFFENNRYENYEYYDGEDDYGNSGPQYRDYGWENYGDIILDRTYETKSLAKNKGVSLLNLDLGKQNTFNGVYLIKVADVNKRWISATRLIAISDVGLIAKQTDDEIFVFANSLKTAAPVGGAKLSFISTNNQVLYTTTTDKDGIAVFSNIKSKFPGFRTGMITCRSEGDFNYLSFRDSRIETSRYDVGGQYDNSGGYSAFIYGDRNIYRPGEIIHVNTIVRDGKWQPAAGIPVKMKLLLPNGKEMSNLKQVLNKQGAFAVDFTIPTAAVTGTYILEVYTANDILLNSRNVSVEEFMPDRIDVKLNTDKPEYKNGDSVIAKINAVNLFGPPASNRNYEMEFSLTKKYFTAKAYPEYNFTVETGDEIKFENSVVSGKTDPQGLGESAFVIDESYDNIGILQAKVFATVFDENGRPVNRVKKFDVFTQQKFFGIHIDDYYASRGQKMQIPLIVVDRSGKAISAQAHVEIINRDWYSVIEKSDNGGYHYVSHKKEIKVFEQNLTIPSGGYKLNFIPSNSGEYEVRISAPGASHFVSSEFWSYGFGFTASNAFEVNTEGQVTIQTDKEKYNAGEQADILFKTPFSGKLLVTIESNHVLEHYYLTTDKKSAMLSVRLKDEYLPNVYITATLFKPVDDGSMPLTVAHGFAPIMVEKKETHLPVTIMAPEKIRSKTKQTIRVKTSPGKNVELTVAVVDEGILQIKNFETPDPHKYFYTKRALQVTSHDMYAKLFPDLKLRKSSAGGDGYDLEKRVNPLTNKRVQLVAKWSGIIKTNSAGEASYTIDVPQFSGDLRIMACAYAGNSFGSSDKHMKVADPVVISSSVPRFLSPGDTLVMPVTVTNTTATTIQTTVNVVTGKLLGLSGQTRQTVTIKANSEERVRFTIVAEKNVGNSVIDVNVSALNEVFNDKTEITIRPVTSLIKETSADVIKPGTAKTIDFKNDFLPSSIEGKIVFSQSPVVQFTDQLIELLDYPHGCAEQTISIAFPQIYYAELARKIKNRPGFPNDANANVRAAIAKLSSMQLYNGSLTLWPGGTKENWWLSVYALHFLKEAEKAGYEVDENYTERIFSYLEQKVKQHETEVYYYWNETGALASAKYAKKEIFYSLFLMALNNRHDRSTMNYYKANPQLLNDDSKYLLAAAYRSIGDLKSYTALLPESFSGKRSVRSDGGSFYSYIRDEAISLNALLETDPDNPQIGTMAKHLSEQIKKERWMSTQERAFSFLALGKLMKQAEQNPVTATILADGKEIGKYTGTDLTLDDKLIAGKRITVTTSGKGNLYYFSELSGLKMNSPVKEEDNYLQVRKTFYDRFGRKTSGTFKQGDLIVIRIALVNKEGSEIENVVITDMLPAGFEIENPRLNGEREMSWIKDQDNPEYLDVRDDRINIYTTAGHTERAYYYMVRCVSTGKFRMGPVSADAMYNAEYHSYNGSGTISVKE